MMRQHSRSRRARTCLLAVCVSLAALASGCGHDGTVVVNIPQATPPIEAAVTGTVFAPNGDFAKLDTWWCRLGRQLQLFSPAYAQVCLQDLQPARGILQVALWLVDLIDARDGEIDNPRLVNQARTDGDGIYRIVDPIADNLDTCRLMVVVGRDESLTRAFVIEHTTNIDAVSEAVVRVVLERVTKYPPVQLCDFTNAGLRNIRNRAKEAACTAKGANVFRINESAYQRVRASQRVQQAIDDATGVPVIE